MEILKLKPATKDYLWGGNLLREKYNKESNCDVIAESWELSAHCDGVSTIMNGKYKNKGFDQYLKDKGHSVIGKEYKKNTFPILIKFIDALKPLSIQVHPNDEYANAFENDNGKTEMWYVLEAEEGSFLYNGFKNDVTKEEFIKSINEGTLENLLNKQVVKKGDVILLEAGSVHAIGKGIVICEIQQSSNVTYRVYDYLRKDKDGNLRELHLDKAIAVSNLKKFKEYSFDNNNKINSSLIRLAKSKYFDVLKGNVKDLKNELKITDESFHSLTFLNGNGKILLDNDSIEYIKGDTFFIPADNGKYTIEGSGEFILTTM